MASWCAVYCVATPAPVPAPADSGVLRLHALRDAKMFMDAANWRLRSPLSGAHHRLASGARRDGRLPASVLHEVALNRAAGDLLLVTVR
jgi:hypothetical protein